MRHVGVNVAQQARKDASRPYVGRRIKETIELELMKSEVGTQERLGIAACGHSYIESTIP
ncbi:hypothetical protein GCM10007874_08690 [Labrys miyagiensis]|uniref:Uncharacterized protein n=1 Tax=Labrys miyagiensis TaxID=346912 RepID=A0ABQ6CDI2_9HYPH|nr:hypothetical protein GCM10007874_08690 [Labrys miyagiensis]